MRVISEEPLRQVQIDVQRQSLPVVPVDALLHISAVEEGRFTQPGELKERFHIGEKLKVRVVDVDVERERISLEPE